MYLGLVKRIGLGPFYIGFEEFRFGLGIVKELFRPYSRSVWVRIYTHLV